MIKTKDYIKEIFLRLTSKTVPYLEEDRFVYDVMPLLFPSDIEKDEHGNYFYKIGESRTVFASHLDTVSNKYQQVTHVIDGDIISTDGKTTLGADDKAGVTVMLYMIENRIPGLYYFFIGEEVGCVGSSMVANYGDLKGNYDRVISFDRRNTGSVITHQSSGRCCSNSFADELCRQFNQLGLSYKRDSGGVYTDSAEFVDIISECTNISVGYYKEHTTSEHQDINHLTKLAIACVSVDWESLPVERDTSVYVNDRWDSNIDEFCYAGGFGYSENNDSLGRDYGYHDHWYDDLGSRKKTRRSKNRNIKKVYYDSGTNLTDLTNDFDSVEDDFDGDKFAWILDKYVDEEFTYEELETIGEYYLDLSSHEDRYFYEYLYEQVVDL